jgi:hypothetical protein
MPYKRVGNVIYHKKDGDWSVKQTATSEANAIRALKLLEGIESGSITPKDMKEYKNRKK